ADVAYAATYNGEQDVYYVRIDCASRQAANLDAHSLRLVKAWPPGGCAAGRVSASWKAAPPVVQTYNLHEIVGYANRRTIANPYPNAPLLAVAARLDACYAPSALPPTDVDYYGVFQVNECSGRSLADP